MPSPGATGNVVHLKLARSETREQALERLFKEHRLVLSGFLSVRLGVREDLDDIVQEVFSRLAQMDELLEKLPPENAGARSYLFSIANRLVIDMQRRNVHWRNYRKNEIDTVDSAGVPSHPSPETLLVARQDLGLVKKVLSEVRPEWSRAFVLNRFKQKSYREVAQEMDISAKTAEKYICKVLYRLREAVIGRKENGDG